VPGTVPPVADERDGLLSFLAQQRSVLRLTAFGLTDEQARLAPSASSLTVGGLIKHSIGVENTWMDTVLGQRKVDPDQYTDGFTFCDDQTLGELATAYDEAAARTERIARDLPLDHPVPVPRDAPWFPADVDAWSLRWVLLHLISETARHAGHADIVRESIDGATAYPLMAAAEGWPDSPWLHPWTATDASTPVS
jgi:hypothetical protein